MFVPAGPLVPMLTPTRPVTRAYPSAAWVPPSSWRTETWRMDDVASALYSGRIAAPGTPKTTSTPSDSITRTTASITFIFGMRSGSFGRGSGGRAGGRADCVLGQVLEVREQRRVVAVAAAVRAQGLQHLVDRGRVGQRDSVLARGLQRDAEVLVVQVDPEAGREVVLEEVAPAELHHLVRGQAAGQDLD